MEGQMMGKKKSSKTMKEAKFQGEALEYALQLGIVCSEDDLGEFDSYDDLVLEVLDTIDKCPDDHPKLTEEMLEWYNNEIEKRGLVEDIHTNEEEDASEVSEENKDYEEFEETESEVAIDGSSVEESEDEEEEDETESDKVLELETEVEDKIIEQKEEKKQLEEEQKRKKDKKDKDKKKAKKKESKSKNKVFADLFNRGIRDPEMIATGLIKELRCKEHRANAFVKDRFLLLRLLGFVD
jgi:chemotaxis protein histidine kinase CheA